MKGEGREERKDDVEPKREKGMGVEGTGERGEGKRGVVSTWMGSTGSKGSNGSYYYSHLEHPLACCC